MPYLLAAFMVLVWACGSLQAPSKLSAYAVGPGAIWESRAISVCWDRSLDPDLTPEAYTSRRQLVQEIVEAEYHSKTSLRFSGWELCTADGANIRISASPYRPVTKSLGKSIDHKKYGMMLNLGFAHYDEACNLSPESLRLCLQYQAIHEFGHALGLVHEHDRPDTDPSRCSFEQEGNRGETMIGEWDAYSIMNYCVTAGPDTASPEGLASFQTHLSPGDIEALALLYPAAG